VRPSRATLSLNTAVMVLVGLPFLIPSRVAGQSPQAQQLTPPPPGNEDRTTLDFLSTSNRAAIAESSVPVLIPGTKDLTSSLSFVFEKYYYAWSSSVPEVELSLEGSRLAYANSPSDIVNFVFREKIRGIPGVTAASEHVLYASWQEFGASYLLSLACTDGKDKRCASAEFLLSVADRLRYVGGGRNSNQVVLPRPAIQENDSGSKKCSEVFQCNPPGQLVSGSGRGREDYQIYAPGIRFPIEKKPAYANSQVWGTGGLEGPKGDQCGGSNYSYPWWDNFCETHHNYAAPMCPDKAGHQGQDIRPPTCVKDVHPVLSVGDGKVTHHGSYTFYVTRADGTRFDYLHMSNVKLGVGTSVKKGDPVGMVSNVFDNTPTTIHLHFEIFQNISGLGFTPVPPYMSLVRSYEELK